MKAKTSSRLAGWLTWCAVAVGWCHGALAQPFPNAWQITDNSTASGSVLYYTNLLSTEHRAAATNHGFRFSVHARFVNDFNGSKSMHMIYGLGTNRYQVWWYLNNDNDLVAELAPGNTHLLTTNGTGSRVYHTHEIIYNPGSRTASYLVDGEIKMSNWSPIDIDWPAGTVNWGAGASGGKAQMNFHRVAFEITNSVVALYDAGFAGDPAPVPEPTNAGWFRHQATPLANTGSTNVSPDTVPLPAAPGATTLSASGVQPYQAILSGFVVPGGWSARTWFEWGTTTNYGNFTPLRQLLSGLTNRTSFETITGLSKGVSYHFRCVASNALGVAYGEDGVFSAAQLFSVANRADSGYGSLRQAVASARPGDTITFATNGPIVLTTGELLITNDLTIIGPGPETLAVSGNNASRVFRISLNADVRLSGITIRNGRSANGANSGGGRGGTAASGGGLYNEGTLSLSNCVIANNVTGMGGAGFSPGLGAGTNGGSGGHGGGLYNAGSVTITACTIVDNSCGRGGHGGNGSAAENATNPDGFAGGRGGAGGVGGGIFNGGSVTLINSKVQDNTAGSGGNGGGGGEENGFGAGVGGDGGDGGQGGAAGGCYSSGSLTLSGCQVSGNVGGIGGTGGAGGNEVSTNQEHDGDGGAGGSGGDGGAIYSYFTLALTNCTVGNNATGAGGTGGTTYGSAGRGGRSGHGGGLFIYDGTATLVGCTLSMNQTRGGGAGGEPGEQAGQGGASGVGGGIYNGGDLTLLACTLAGNKTGNAGNGGVSSGYINSRPGRGGTVGAGGAIYNNDALTLLASTVSANKTGNGGNGGDSGKTWGADGGDGGDGGGVLNAVNASFATLRNSLIAFNTNGTGGSGGVAGGILNSNGAAGSAGVARDLHGTFETQGHNLIGRRDGASFVPAIQTTDYVPDLGFSINPLLGPLANNGGPTMTMALLPGSRAIGTGDDSLIHASATDQRGYLRSSGGHVDIGAFEVQVVDPANPPSMTNAYVQANGAMTFSFTNNPGLRFQILTSTNVALPLSQWTVIGIATESSPGNYHYATSTSTNAERFYALRAD